MNEINEKRFIMMNDMYIILFRYSKKLTLSDTVKFVFNSAIQQKWRLKVDEVIINNKGINCSLNINGECIIVGSNYHNFKLYINNTEIRGGNNVE